MPTMLEVRHLSVSIDRPPGDVYRFAATVENLPKWATGLGTAMRNVNGEWIADGPTGPAKVRFVAPNELGVLDHDVFLESGAQLHNPIRVIPNGRGSEFMFTLFRRPGISDEQFAEDASWVAKDLNTLKRLLEQ